MAGWSLTIFVSRILMSINWHNLVFIADDSEKALIEKAMETFHKKTCVRFVPHRGQSDYLQIEGEIGWVHRRWR